MAQTLSLRRRITVVLIGGFLGTLTRFLLSLLIQKLLGKEFPFDIFLINITGAFVLAFVTVLADSAILVGPMLRLFITVGFLAAYTTFSSLALSDVQLLEAGKGLPGLLFLLGSLDEGYVAVLLGDWLGHLFAAYMRRRNASLLPSPQEPLIKTFKAQTLHSISMIGTAKIFQPSLDRQYLLARRIPEKHLGTTFRPQMLLETTEQKEAAKMPLHSRWVGRKFNRI